MSPSKKATGYLLFISSLLYLNASTNTTRAQDTLTTGNNIQIVQDQRVDQLISKHIHLNQNQGGINGYRIQIFFDSGTNSKINAQSSYESFRARYPEIQAYLTFKTPNYKVRVGDFRTRLDARRFLNGIIVEYPNAWIVSDEINLPQVEQLNTILHE